MLGTFLQYAGLTLPALIFLANALGVIDQSRASREMVDAGIPERFARPAVLGGRVVQLVGAIGLFIPVVRPWSALALAAFVTGATCIAHAFWRSARERRGEQLASFLKNGALVGGRLLATGWSHA